MEITMHKCEKCDKEVKIINITKYQKNPAVISRSLEKGFEDCWEVCNDCFAPLFEFESNKYKSNWIRMQIENEYEQKLINHKNRQNKFHKLFSNFYIKL